MRTFGQTPDFQGVWLAFEQYAIGASETYSPV